LNALIDNSGVTARIFGEIHESLIERDPSTLEWRCVLAESFEVEDQLVLEDGTTVFGRVERAGDVYTVTPLSPLAGSGRSITRFAVSDQEQVIRGSVFTFRLRDGVRFHDGHPLDVDDVLFSLALTRNPFVRCDEKRFQWQGIEKAERVDERTVRFFFARQYFLSIAALEGLVILPRHVFDLRDPDNPAFDADATDEAQGRFVNEHPANRAWVGLGPYRVIEFTDRWVDAERFAGYFAPREPPGFGVIRWRVLTDDSSVVRALLAGEIDFTTRLLAEDYFGPSTASERFSAGFEKGAFYTPRMSYVAWNLDRARFQDVRVRRALAQSFDWDGFIRSFYGGLAERVTSEIYDGSPAYDRSVAPIAFDRAAAVGLLEHAGWIDRDGDGWLDRDGAPFEITLLVQAGAKASEAFAQALQEALKAVGVRLAIAALDWATLVERVRQRDFDAVYKAWVMPVESDPEQIWHSRWAKPGGGNDSGLRDAEVDRLIEAYLAELDPGARAAIGRELHRRLYSLQPYMYGVKVPHKFALSKRIGGFAAYPIDPGFRAREWTPRAGR
jgi:peptide/nickel transport system substrate-binding protein